MRHTNILPSFLLSLLLPLLLHAPITHATYTLTDNYSKDTFFGNFTAFTERDPTNGFVSYQPYAAAAAQSLIHSVPNAAYASYIAVDSSPLSPVPNSSPSSPGPNNGNSPQKDGGRNSVRISSIKTFNRGLFIVDLLHMPKNTCGSWPAFWLLGPDWPNGGEIDILEGVNEQSHNQMTLHTAKGCNISPTSPSPFAGKVESSSCGPDEKNTGCAITSPSSSKGAFGADFNAQQGGVYATEWTSSSISIWFFPRSSIPGDIASATPDPSKWGLPQAKWSAQTGCNVEKYFKDMRIVFNTAFCGDWAGKVWESGGCAKKTGVKTCEEFVRSKGEVFKEGWWLVNYVRVFQQQQEGGQKGNKQGGGKMRRVRRGGML